MSKAIFAGQFINQHGVFGDTLNTTVSGSTGTLHRDSQGHLVITETPPGGTFVPVVLPGTTLDNIIPWFRNLDTLVSYEWHPINYYNGFPEGNQEGLSVYLTKPVIIIPSDAVGNIVSYDGVTGEIVTLMGGVDVTIDCTFSFANSVNLTVTINDLGTYQITELSADVGTIDIITTYNGLAYTIVLTAGKLRAGVIGQNTTTYFINTSSPVIVKNAPDAATPGAFTPVTVFGRRVSGASTVDNTGLFLTVTANGDTESLTASQSPVTIAPVSTTTKTSYTIRLYDAASSLTRTLLDTEVLPVVFQGASGTNGLDGLTFVLTNDSHTIPTLADGTGGDYVGSGTDIYVYEGASQLQYDGIGTSNGTFTVTKAGTGVTPGNITDGGAFARAAACNTLIVDVGNIAFTISGKRANGTSFSVAQYQTLTKSKQGSLGATGTNARSVNLTTTTQAFVYTAAGNTPAPGSVTITATALHTSGTVYYEFLVNNVSVQNTTSGVYNYTPQAAYGSMPQQILVKIREGASNSTVLATDVMSMFGLKPGADGINGTRTAVLDMYKWSTSAPTTFPSGTSTFTWATNTFTAPGTSNGWTLTPASGAPGETLYIVKQGYGDNGSSATSTVTWSTSFSVPVGTAGISGVNGQRVGVLEVFKWSVVQPADYPAGTSTYTWSDGSFTEPSTPNGWASEPGATIPGGTLWGVSIIISNTSTSSTDTGTWNSTSSYAVGAAGSDGLTCILTNETHTLPATSAGVVTDFANSGTDIYLYEGATPIQYDGVGTANGTFSVSPTVNNITVGTITDSGAMATVSAATAMGTGLVATIIFHITGKRSTGQAFTLTKMQTFSKSLQGGQGIDGTPGMRTTTLIMYQWAIAKPTVFPQGSSLFNWTSGTFNTPNVSANNWLLDPGAAQQGYFLWACKQFFSTSSTSNTSTVVWTATDCISFGYSGTNGVSGGVAQRGSGTFYTFGSVWSDAVALAAVHAIYPGTLVYGDTVTISNGSTFALTKYCTSGVNQTWAAPGQVIDGNLLVTGSVKAAKIDSNGLSLRDPNGNILFYSGGDFPALDFARVGGGTKPDNNATFGANYNNLQAGTSANLLSNASLASSLDGWGYFFTPTTGATFNAFYRKLPGEAGAVGNFGGVVYSLAGPVNPSYPSVHTNAMRVPCKPGDIFELQALVQVFRGRATLQISFANTTGNWIGGTNVVNGVTTTPHDNNPAGFSNRLQDWFQLWGFYTIPNDANIASCYLEIRIERTQTFANTDIYIGQAYLGRAHVGQTEKSNWVDGTPRGAMATIDKVTPGNVFNLFQTDTFNGTYVYDLWADKITVGYLRASVIKADRVYFDTLNVAGGAITAVESIETGIQIIPLPAATDLSFSTEKIIATLPIVAVDVDTVRLVTVSFVFHHEDVSPGSVTLTLSTQFADVGTYYFIPDTRLINNGVVSANDTGHTAVFRVSVAANTSRTLTAKIKLRNGVGTTQRWAGSTFCYDNILISHTGKR